MKELFLDYQHSKMLKELEFNEPCLKIYCAYSTTGDNEIKLWKSETIFEKDSSKNSRLSNENSCTAPIYQQVKQFLWEKYEISIEVERVSISTVLFKVRVYQFVNGDNELIQYLHFESPIEAEIEGIKTAISHLRKQLTR